MMKCYYDQLYIHKKHLRKICAQNAVINKYRFIFDLIQCMWKREKCQFVKKKKKKYYVQTCLRYSYLNKRFKEVLTCVLNKSEYDFK